MKRLIVILASLAIFSVFGCRAQNHALNQLEHIAGSSVDATHASSDAEARSRASEYWGNGGPGNAVWKANRRDSWNARREARSRIRQQRREARANRRRYHLRDYQPRW